MIIDPPPQTARRARRAAVSSLAATALAGPLALAPSAAATPPDAWSDTDNPSLVTALLVLVGGAAVLFAVIFLLSYLPSMVRGQRGASVETWRDEPEWFGGPRQGPAATSSGSAPEPDEVRETGGASARW